MKKRIFILVACLLFNHAAVWAGADVAETPATDNEDVAPALRFKAKSIDGEDVDLAKYSGKVVIIVNVASECGVTSQYAGLQALHEELAEHGLCVLGFPSNDFGKQEPGKNAEIKAFCEKNYRVTFDMFAKVKVTGEDACGFYKYLATQEAKPKGKAGISWNFEKVILGRDGNVIAHFESHVEPTSREFLEVLADALSKEEEE